MKIAEKLATAGPFISVEYFPPKEQQEWPAFFQVVDRLAQLNPLFASVTYGAGGSTQSDSLEIVTRMQQEHGLETLAHLTCVGAESSRLTAFLDALATGGVSNVLALRGDLPKDAPPEALTTSPLLYASDLVTFTRSIHPEMGIGVAGYPEAHPEALSAEADLGYLKLKLDLGGDFAITQLFFDNALYFDFVAKARERGITKPIIPGILPVVSLKVIKRIVSLCGATIPADFLARLEEADRQGGAAAVQSVGIEHARNQAHGLLAGGAPGVHLYTLNRAEAILEITDGLL
ncbi:methylenetetrahydrofolate reductase [Trichlorobacter ammonificans]|uniref:Methylenetetrahydrofolate reductase n=1 Tax=Trichlorobacter ammonificans TaxID=2916410 RepID=A0ABM9D9C0_9BACT|nr:methylenetetrahydrofolate reductase [Trichlorobacter ammonificans]CAH2031165.1 5,10-methylenetetrahydrofolate reductase [Trichlorobacter ammonificans]